MMEGVQYNQLATRLVLLEYGAVSETVGRLGIVVDTRMAHLVLHSGMKDIVSLLLKVLFEDGPQLSAYLGISWLKKMTLPKIMPSSMGSVHLMNEVRI